MSGTKLISLHMDINPTHKLCEVVIIISFFRSRFPWWLRQYRIYLQYGRPRFDPWVGKLPGRRAWQPMPVFLPGKSCGQRSPMGYSPWGRKEWDATEHTHTHSFVRLGEGYLATEQSMLTAFFPLLNKSYT